MEFVNFGDFVNKMMGMQRAECKTRLVSKLSPELIARNEELNAQSKAIEKTINRLGSKLKANRNRFWADVCDKYDVHGLKVTLDKETGELHEILPPE